MNPFSAFATAHNPFASVAPPADVDAEPAGNFTYRLIKSGPDVNPDEVEVAHVQSIEVMVMWGTNVLHTASLEGDKGRAKGFSVGEEAARCDFFLPSEVLGETRVPIVTRGGALVILPRTTGWLEMP